MQQKLIGMKKEFHSTAITMYFSNGDIKSCWEGSAGFKVNNELNEVIVTINGYKDKIDYSGKKSKVIGKDETEIESCIVEGPEIAINEYLYKLGVFSDKVEVNNDLIRQGLQSSLESSISSLSSQISFLEHSIQNIFKPENA